jgi:hypothetical protein
MIEIVVVSEGNPFPEGQYSPRPQDGECWVLDSPDSHGHRWGRPVGEHRWYPAAIGEHESTWYCPRCRRIERMVAHP